MQPNAPPDLERLRAAIARIERGCPQPQAAASLPFGLTDLDAALPGGGLPLGALHEISSGRHAEHAAAGALFAAGILARIPGPVLWVLERRDLFAPGLASAGLHPDRVVYADADTKAGRSGALLVMEEGLRHRGLAGVVAEVSGRLSLTASRRLQLAAEASGAAGLLLRRQYHGPQPDQADAIAAVTRWRITPLPSPPPLPHAPEVPGLSRARWHLELLRCRGGRTGSWVTEACDASGHLGMVAPLADRSAAAGVRDADRRHAVGDRAA